MRREIVGSHGRGAAVGKWMAARLDELEASVETDLADGGSPTTHTRLLRHIDSLDLLHVEVVAYRRDIGRNDLPAGLLYAVDAIVDSVLGERIDVLIHDNTLNMYTTTDLADRGLGPLLEAQENTADGDVLAPPPPWPGSDLTVVLSLPGLDLANAMLPPALTHEVGHIASKYRLRHRIASAPDWPKDAIATALEETRGVSGDKETSRWQRTLSDWSVEFLCDGIVTALAGPSLVLSLVAFLGVGPLQDLPAAGAHPESQARVARCLAALEAAGWKPWLERVTPKIYRWLDEIRCAYQARSAGMANNKTVGQMAYLLRASDVCAPNIDREATLAASGRLDPGDYERLREEIVDRLWLGVPPSQIRGEAVAQWVIVLGAWEAGLINNDRPEAIAEIAGEQKRNSLVIKSIELAAVAASWSRSETQQEPG